MPNSPWSLSSLHVKHSNLWEKETNQETKKQNICLQTTAESRAGRRWLCACRGLCRAPAEGREVGAVFPAPASSYRLPSEHIALDHILDTQLFHHEHGLRAVVHAVCDKVSDDTTFAATIAVVYVRLQLICNAVAAELEDAAQ